MKEETKNIIQGLKIRESQLFPLHIRLKVTLNTNKEVVAKRQEAVSLSRKAGSTLPAQTLKQSSLFDWMYDGERVSMSQRLVTPVSINADRPATIEGQWGYTKRWDGQKYVTMQSQSSKTEPVLVTVVPSTLPPALLTTERLSIMEPGIGLLLMATDGQSWSEYLKGQQLTISDAVWNGLQCVTVTWQNPQKTGPKTSIYVIPSRSFCVVRKEIRVAGGEVLTNIEAENIQQVGGVWLPKKVKKTVYSLSRDMGEHLPWFMSIYEVEQVQVSLPLPTDSFNFVEKQLPKGSRVNDVGAGTINYVGDQVTDTDAVKLYKVLRRYIIGEISPQGVQDALAQSKVTSFPFNCGPYSLLAVSQILGISASSQEMSRIAGTDEEGVTTIAGLVKALKVKGITAKAFEMDVKDLREVPVPAIIHVNPEHYLVLIKFEGSDAVLLDPPTRTFVMTEEQLTSAWTGRAVVLTEGGIQQRQPLKQGKEGIAQSQPTLSAILPPVEADPTAVVGLPISKVEVGQLAPEISFLDMNGQTRRLSELRGKKNLLLTFFPRCFTGGCAGQLASLRDMQSDFAATDTEIWAVSVDPAEGEKGQIAFAKFLNLNFPLIPDPERKLSLLYGATQNKQQLAARMSVLIDKSGTVRLVDTHVHIATHGADLLEKMRDLGMTK